MRACLAGFLFFICPALGGVIVPAADFSGPTASLTPAVTWENDEFPSMTRESACSEDSCLTQAWMDARVPDSPAVQLAGVDVATIGGIVLLVIALHLLLAYWSSTRQGNRKLNYEPRDRWKQRSIRKVV